MKGLGDWPPELDALIAAPDQHNLLMENDHVRVIDTIMPLGTTVPLHTHLYTGDFHETITLGTQRILASRHPDWPGLEVHFEDDGETG